VNLRGTPLLAGAVLGRRAQRLLAEACLACGARTVLIPALYCADVVAAIQAAGLAVRYYDIEPGLAPSRASLERRLDDGCAVIWHHPFGSYQAPPVYPGVHTVEDGCFSLRTITGLGVACEQVPLCVCSLRKEFGLSLGGLAFGHLASRVWPPAARTDPDTATAFAQVDLAASSRDGQAVTRLVRAAFPGRLPSVARSAAVLSQIPLLSSRRDDIVPALRAAGILAWYWQDRVPGLTQAEAPVAWEVWKRLFLVPLPEAGSPDLDTVTRIPAEAW
jgi:hypothetical protein